MSPPAGFMRRFRVEHGDMTASQLRQAAKAWNFGFVMYAHDGRERGYRGLESSLPANIWLQAGGEK